MGRTRSNPLHRKHGETLSWLAMKPNLVMVPGGSRGIRTPDHILKRDLLYQLSYAPTPQHCIEEPNIKQDA